MISQDDLDIVSEFLIRFYYQEPDYFEATIRALQSLKDRHQYKWELATVFRRVLESPLPEDTLRDLVLFSANRFVQNHEDAKAILKRIYYDNVLYTAVNFDDLKN